VAEEVVLVQLEFLPLLVGAVMVAMDYLQQFQVQMSLGQAVAEEEHFPLVHNHQVVQVVEVQAVLHHQEMDKMQLSIQAQEEAVQVSLEISLEAMEDQVL
jgi:hypothetical protein